MRIFRQFIPTAFILGCSLGHAEHLQQPFELTILHINDHHSHLDEEKTKLKFDAGKGIEEFEVTRGGIARVATMINELSLPNKNIVKVHAGDAVTGDFYYNLNGGKADAMAMNQICFDTFTLGNHEFDAKDQGLNQFIHFLKHGNCPQPTQILSANVSFGASSPLYKTNLVQKTAIIEKQGQKIAFIGLTVADKTKNASQPNLDTIFANELEIAQGEINRLKAEGINKIILQTHLGYKFDIQLAQQLTGVNVIVGADSHTLLGPSNLNNIGLKPEGAYPTQVKNKDGEPICIAQAWQYNYAVGELNIKFDENGKVLSCTGTPHILIGDDIKRASNNSDLSKSEKQKIQEQIKQQQLPVNIIQPDPAMLQVLATYSQQKQRFTNRVVGYAKEDLCVKSMPVPISNNKCGKYGGELQQLFAKALLEEGKRQFNADFSLQNGGGVRIPIAKGPVTVGMVYQLLPFKNTLMQLNMTGAEIKNTLEQVMDKNNLDKDAGSYPYMSGLHWTVDLNQPKGNRIQNLEQVLSSGQIQPLDLNKIYKLATIDFLARGSGHTLHDSEYNTRRSP
ncbi:NAD nucleotidase [Acinetobacter nectaris CIP 110549]|uniref:NAD nucleotidase n=1 Tax=Acinetobacter nectaris CIP 110549 TaxID=1392540 RepID=V2T2L9_9GAMM|nr:5'-nucleotidase C-terminal domain-containing protein [Acinetobacter nectaris]ESK36698.1 NAD nucleotidase [Acinetobacter nectaris CIP 110549]